MKRKSVASSGILFLVLFGNRSLFIVKVGFWKEPKGARSKLRSSGCEERDASKTQQCQQQRWLPQPAFDSQRARSHLLTELLVGELPTLFQTIWTNFAWRGWRHLPASSTSRFENISLRAVCSRCDCCCDSSCMQSPAPPAAFETLRSSCLCAVPLIKIFKCVLATFVALRYLCT